MTGTRYEAPQSSYSLRNMPNDVPPQHPTTWDGFIQPQPSFERPRIGSLLTLGGPLGAPPKPRPTDAKSRHSRTRNASTPLLWARANPAYHRGIRSGLGLLAQAHWPLALTASWLHDASHGDLLGPAITEITGNLRNRWSYLSQQRPNGNESVACMRLHMLSSPAHGLCSAHGTSDMPHCFYVEARFLGSLSRASVLSELSQCAH